MRPIRNKDPEAYRLITIRTQEARLWITPSSDVRKTIGGIIARYQEILGIEIYAYCVLGNHYHLVVKAPRGNIDEFCENVNREIARRLNWKHRREGKFWGRRYDDQEILSEDDLLEAFLYVCTNATRHGLVKNSDDWRGLNCVKHVLNEKDRKFSFHHFSAKQHDERVSTHKLKLTILPQLRDRSKNQRRKMLSKLLKLRMAKIWTERKEQGQGFLEMAKIDEQKPGIKPQNVARSRRPLCYTKQNDLRRRYINASLHRRAHYRSASIRFRLGDKDVKFPEHSFYPPTHRLPRIDKFIPMSPSYLQVVN